MKTKHALKLAGSAAQLSRILGITASAISQWGPYVPELRVVRLKSLKPEWFTEKPARGHAA